jgi:tetratricopeptide (TPR) repeat protein
MQPTAKLQAPEKHLIAARLRALAENCLYTGNGPHSFNKLEQYLNKAANLHPEAVETYILMAKAYDLLKNTLRSSATDLNKKIVEVLNHALEHDPQNTEVKVMLAALFVENGDSKLAMEYLKDILALRSDSFILDQVGNCYYALGNIAAAAESFSKALVQQPRHHDLHTKLGICLFEKEDYLEAYTHAIKALILYPNYRNAVLLKKAAGKYAATLAVRSVKEFEKEFDDNLLDDLKTGLFASEFEQDALTKLANEASLQLWSEQTHLKDLWALVVHIPDLREISLTHEPREVNDLIMNIAGSLRTVYPEAVFASRPKSDKLAIFNLSDPQADLGRLAEAFEEFKTLCAPKIGIGHGQGVLASLGLAIKETLKDEPQ